MNQYAHALNSVFKRRRKERGQINPALSLTGTPGTPLFSLVAVLMLVTEARPRPGLAPAYQGQAAR